MFSLPKDVQSIGKVLDNGIKLFITEFKTIVLLSFIANLGFILPSIVVGVGLGVINEEPSSFSATTLLVALFSILSYIFSMFIYFMIAIRLWGAMHSNTPNIRESFKHVLTRLFPLIGALILYVFAVGGGFLLLIIPGIILMLSLGFYSYCILFEGDGAIDSLKHSHKLVWGNWWRTAIILTVPMFIMMALYALMILLLPFMSFQDLLAGTAPSGEDYSIWLDIGEVIIGTVVYSIWTCIYLVLFYDLKLRKEGGDIQQRIESMG